MEKFALLNLLNLLQGLTPKTNGGQTPDANAEQPENNAFNAQSSKTPQQEQTANAYPNVMASVLERHEIISNRIKNKK